MGAGKFLKERKPSVKLVLADPKGSQLAALQAGTPPKPSSYLIEGIGGDTVPGIVNIKEIDHAITVDDEESIRTTHELLDKEALFVGGSSGCAVAAAIKYCQQSTYRGLTVVAILPSTGRLYTKTVFNEEWLSTRIAPTGRF
jgi:cystathionine beta-synthase